VNRKTQNISEKCNRMSSGSWEKKNFFRTSKYIKHMKILVNSATLKLRITAYHDK
jgi:hypothetical protein